MTETRYDRQTLIPGWEQDRLAKAHVGVLGCGLAGSLLAWGLAALGVGHVYLMDDRRSAQGENPALCLPQYARKDPASALAATLRCMNPAVTARALPIGLRYTAMTQAVPPCDVLVDTMDEASQHCSLDLARERGIPLIQLSTGAAGGACHVNTPGNWLDVPPRAEGAPGAAASMVMAGLALEDIRQLLLPLPLDEAVHSHALGYNWSRADRFVGSRSIPAPAELLQLPPGCLVVGAGALGTWVGLALALAGARDFTLVDPDTVAATNLNRQVLYFDALGQPKVTTLATRLNRLCPEAHARGIIDVVQPAHLSGAPLVLICVDSFAVRAQVNGWVTDIGDTATMINGGTSPFCGEVEVYRPGQTACLECRIDVSSLASLETSRARCAATPEPSVVISNMITAGLMVGEVCAISAGLPLMGGTLQYDASARRRVGMSPALPACACWQRTGEPLGQLALGDDAGWWA